MVGKRRYVYLGRRVSDAPPHGLSSVREVRDIARQIEKDAKRGRISKAKANSRLLTLWFAAKRAFTRHSQKARALRAINAVRRRLGFKPIKPRTWRPVGRRVRG